MGLIIIVSIIGVGCFSYIVGKWAGEADKRAFDMESYRDTKRKEQDEHFNQLFKQVVEEHAELMCDGSKYNFAPNQPNERVAKQVINGGWGDGWGSNSERVVRLTLAGYDPLVIQKEILELFEKSR